MMIFRNFEHDSWNKFWTLEKTLCTVCIFSPTVTHSSLLEYFHLRNGNLSFSGLAHKWGW